MFVPNNAAINALGAGVYEQEVYTVNWSQSGMGMMGGSSGSDDFTVYLTGANESNTASVLLQPLAISQLDTAAYDSLAFVPVNPSFETADTTGWIFSNGAASAVYYHNGGMDSYFATDGDYFLMLEPGAADVFTTARQTVTVEAGQSLSGMAAFDSEDASPHNDSAHVAFTIA